MKFLCLIIIAISSCKATAVNGLVNSSYRQAEYVVTLRILNRMAACPDLISKLQKNGFNPQIEYYPVNMADRSVLILSFQGYDISGEDLARLKKIIGSCKGVIDVKMW